LSQSPIDLPSALALLQGRLQRLQLLDKLNNHKLLPSLQLHTDGPEVDVLRPGWRRLPRPSPGAPSARRLRGRIELPPDGCELGLWASLPATFAGSCAVAPVFVGVGGVVVPAPLRALDSPTLTRLSVRLKGAVSAR
jgi:hypothetical protein